MYLERFYDEKLAQASYLVGCAATGEAVVIDPNRDVDQFIRAAERQGLRITHVTETHIHADFVSGLRELVHRTGARAYVSAEGGPDWQYAFADEIDAVLLRDGDHFMVGNVRIEAMHTPGHTPEHLTFLVTDTVAADQPMGAFTGDFIFVGDVGRPDLLERAAGVGGTMEPGARALFHSLERFKKLPDHLQIWPAHGAGSACGKSLGAVPQSTLGYERLFNWGLSYDDEDAFVEAVLSGQPEPPKYFAEMKRINKVGPALLSGRERPERLPEERLEKLLEEGAMIVDTRPAAEYAEGHVPGTISIPLNRSFNTWAGWFVSYEEPFYLIVDDAAQEGAYGRESGSRLDEAVRDLALIGLDRIGGIFGAEAVEAWAEGGRKLATVEEMTIDELDEKIGAGAVNVIDVRGQTEWEAGRIPGVPNIPLGYLPDRLDEIATDKPLVVHCQSGGRSHMATSLLQARGYTNVINLKGGFGHWQAAGKEVERGVEGVAA